MRNLLFFFILIYISLDVAKAQQSDLDSLLKISDNNGGFPSSIISNGDIFGSSVAGLGDLDGDGYLDIVVGAQWDNYGGTDRGAIYVLFLNGDGTVKDYQKIANNYGGMGNVIQNVDVFGCSIANIGDIDGDGIVDIAVGAMYSNDGGADRGSLWILRLKNDGTVKAYQKISDTAGSFTGTLNTQCYLGTSIVNMGDLNSDGINDIAVGAARDNDGGSFRGALWFLYLDTNGTVKTHAKISDTIGGFTGTLDYDDYFGFSLANTGDINGDGINDIAVGALLDDDGGTNRGAVWILFLDTNETVKSHQKISSTTGSFTGTLNDADQFGCSITSLGDMDGDGINDILVGARFDDDGGTDRGAVWILNLDSNGTVINNYKISDTLSVFSGNLSNGDLFGHAIANIGDINRDGVNDFGVGAIKKTDGGTDRGAIFLMFFERLHSRNNFYVGTKKKLDGGYYNIPENNIFPFQIDEDYNSQGNLTFELLDSDNNVVSTSQTLPIAIGDNRYKLDIDSFSSLTSGYYVLRITNNKSEKRYLRLKKL
jgi:hypothetical protein